MTGSALAAVQAYYDRHRDRVWHRPTQQRVEYALTLRALRDSVPASSRILIAGGGSGRYAIALASVGHQVTVLDFSPRLVDLTNHYAQQRKLILQEAVCGSVLDLSPFATSSFDAVLLLGSMYHLPQRTDRDQALYEVLRVLVPEGLVICTFLTRYAPLRDLARTRPQSLIPHAARYEHLLTYGTFPSLDNETLPYAYYASSEEILSLLEDHALIPRRILAVESIVDGLDTRLTGLHGPAWEAWADLLYDLADDPGLLAASTHLLAIAKREEEKR